MVEVGLRRAQTRQSRNAAFDELRRGKGGNKRRIGHRAEGKKQKSEDFDCGKGKSEGYLFLVIRYWFKRDECYLISVRTGIQNSLL